MAKVSLRAYDREIEGLIEQGQRLDEAIAHCRHILKSYPKQLETYRLLGKAYLEAKRYNEAVDIFQRVLNAVPDDFVAHVGMSIIADEQNKLDEALWHMERAFEVQPSNAAIQGELQRLFGRRDGVEPPKIRLTRGALAHMYMQGDLFTQAIAEIRAVLSNDPKRIDMQALLAKAYFRNGQKTEATEICSTLLTTYPYCLDANRLMVEILPGTALAESIQDYRQRVNELDPYAAFAQGSVLDTDKVPDGVVSLERLEYTDLAFEKGAALGFGLGSDSAPFGRTTDQPGWLRGASAPVATAPAASSLTAGPVSPNEDQLPDFLRNAGWFGSNDAIQDVNPIEETESESAAVQGDLPDWVKALAPDSEEEPAPQASSSFSESPFQPDDSPDWLHDMGGAQPSGVTSSPSDGLQANKPDWIKNLQGAEPDELAQSSNPVGNADWLSGLDKNDQVVNPEADPLPAPSTEPVVDWLKDLDRDIPEPVQNEVPQEVLSSPQAGSSSTPGDLGSLGTTSQEKDEAMAWLEGLAAKHGAKPDELVTDPNARTDIAPGWVDKARKIGEGVPESRAIPPESEIDVTGNWLRSQDLDAGKVSTPDKNGSGLDDLRKNLSDVNDFTWAEADNDLENESASDLSGAPDWLGKLGQEESPMQSQVENVPDWLHTPPSEVDESQAGLPTPTPAAEKSPMDLPQWLAGLDEEKSEPSTPPSSSDDLPSWLKSDAEPEPQPQPAEPTHPADWKPVLAEASSQAVPDVKQPGLSEAEDLAAVDIGSKRPQTVAPDKVRTSPPATPAPSLIPAAVVGKGVSSSARSPSDAGSLGGAKSELGRGNIAAALNIYGKLIRKGKSLEDIIRDLRDALYRYPVEVPIWQALGDAYMRANRLQEALDAYTKAEELLR